MHHAKSAALVAALATVSAAKPVELTSRSPLRINQVAVPAKKPFSGAQQIVKAYAKYGKLHAVPDHVRVAAHRARSGSARAPFVVNDSGSNGSVAANPSNNDEQYLCPVSVGGQTLNLDFDTGSADLWVFSTELDSAQSSGHQTYDPSKSGKKEDGSTWKISYGDQSSASGDVYADTVIVGGVTATSQAVEAAQTVSDQFVKDTANDGLLGLAFSSINTVTPNKATTFFDTVSKSLPQALFTARLRKGAPGVYDFGFIDNSLYTGDITYVDADSSQGFWGLTYSVNGKEGQGIADTGTTLMLLPDDVVSAYYSKTGAQSDSSQGGYTFPCSTDLPDFTLTIGGATFTVPGSYINYAPTSDGSSTCFGGLQSSGQIGTNILGDIFLKAHFVVFDNSQSTPRLGFAKGA